jgi:hypothetical protein
MACPCALTVPFIEHLSVVQGLPNQSDPWSSKLARKNSSTLGMASSED